MTDTLFDIQGKVIAITGGAGVLGGALARGLAARGAAVAILDFNEAGAKALAEEIVAEGGKAVAIAVNVLEKQAVQQAHDECVAKLGPVDVLINGAGGNKKEATCVPPESLFFDLDPEAFRWVFDLNLIGTVLPSMIFGRALAKRGEGVIINISSMCAFTPLTRVGAYSAAKAGVSNFTQWLSTYLCQNHATDLRVNAIAPGFFLTEQNRFLLTNEDGSPTERGQQIIDHTPMGRYGQADELLGTLVWLISDAAKFVTGIVVPVDGGFSAFSGV